MSSANTLVQEDGFGLIPRQHSSSNSTRQSYEIVRRYTMTNSGKSSVRLISWGAGIQSVKIPNDKGILGDVVLGYDSMNGYLKNKNNQFRNISGRVENHISSNGQLSKFRKQKNFEEDTKNRSHGFDDRNWDSYILGNQVVMSNLSNNSGAKLLTQVKYSWTDENQLNINIQATSTRPTPVNVTARCLFNLAGHGTGAKELKKHVVTINAEKWTFMDLKDGIPNGAIRSVKSTIYDLRFPTCLTNERLCRVPGGGYDHNLCIDSPSVWCYRFHARVLHPGSGRFMEVYSNQPGIQFYTGNDIPDPKSLQPSRADIDHFNCCQGACGDQINSGMKSRLLTTEKQDDSPAGKDGIRYQKHGGMILSPQNYPNAINTEGFPPCVLRPGKIYVHDLTYKFGVLRKK
ncbi:galactose mutarotase-like [Athalia rosae]|uniref:galactose mutarotase-like n=1 Tax=Athalia rosae TaxID=37344 RepID=UPI0020334ED1|nr:galactose mutarotase-like [Athalia rosae]